jgi:hypothetical protein
MRTVHRLRLAAILVLGAFALHQLRYLIAYGGSSSSELARQGHAYMAGAAPILVVFGVSALLATLLRGSRGAELARASFTSRLAVFAVSLFTIYALQESTEGLLAVGHPDGIAALLANGGWVALPLAAAIGALSALLVRALERVEVAIQGCRRGRPPRRRAPRVRGTARAAIAVKLASTPLAFGLARRPPPPASA